MAVSAAAAFAVEPEAPYGYAEAVQAYRAENYAAAQGMFARLHRNYPENTRITYYLAITEAQQGHIQETRRLYNEILLLDPNGNAARLAREGLTYLPKDNVAAESNSALDAPPKVTAAIKRIELDNSLPNAVNASAPATVTADAANHQTETGQAVPQASTPWPGANASAPGMGQNTATAQTYNGMSPQDMMMWQMMMSQGNNNNNNGMNGGINPMMMMAPQMFGNTGNSNGANGTPSNIDPNIMSTMLMNQMMQNFSFDTNRDSDR